MVCQLELLILYTVTEIIILVDTKVTPIWNTMAVIPGHISSEVVVIGNHRDGVFHSHRDS